MLSLDSTNRPAWYKAALFTELYFLVDGATIWHDGPVEPVEPDGPDPLGGLPASLHRPEDLAELALIECFDYPFCDTLDVHFYAAFAVSRLFPRLEASISRAFAASVCLDDPARIIVEATREIAPRKVAGALPHDLGGPSDDPLVRVNAYHFQESNSWKDLNPKFVLQAWRDRTIDPDPASYLAAVWPAVREAIEYLARFDSDGDGLPEHSGPDQTYDTWPMQGPAPMAGASGWRRSAPGRRWPGPSARMAAPSHGTTCSRGPRHRSRPVSGTAGPTTTTAAAAPRPTA